MSGVLQYWTEWEITAILLGCASFYILLQPMVERFKFFFSSSITLLLHMNILSFHTFCMEYPSLQNIAHYFMLYICAVDFYLNIEGYMCIFSHFLHVVSNSNLVIHYVS